VFASEYYCSYLTILLPTPANVTYEQHPRTTHSSLYGRISVHMTAGLMRSLFSSCIRAQLRLRHTANGLAAPQSLGLKLHQRTLSDARPRQASISKTYFTSTSANPYPELGGSDTPPPDQRTVKLGNSMFICRHILAY
jgi:hypothetical protein